MQIVEASNTETDPVKRSEMPALKQHFTTTQRFQILFNGKAWSGREVQRRCSRRSKP